MSFPAVPVGVSVPALPLMPPPPPPLTQAAAAQQSHYGMYTPPNLQGLPKLPPTGSLQSMPGMKPSPQTFSNGSTPTTTSATTPTNKATTSSFAAALRNLAKNATVNEKQPPAQATKRPSPGAASTTTFVPPPKAMMTPPSATISPTPSFLDVRKGFDRSSDPSTEAMSTTIMSSSITTNPVSAVSASGFQPYRPDSAMLASSKPLAGQPFNQVTSNAAAAAALHSNYAAAAAMAAGYHPAMFGGLPYGIDADALYRAQLERYAAATVGLNRSPHLMPSYQSILGGYPPELVRQMAAGAMPHAVASTTTVSSTGVPTAATPTAPKDKKSEMKEKKKEAKKNASAAKQQPLAATKTEVPSTPVSTNGDCALPNPFSLFPTGYPSASLGQQTFVPPTPAYIPPPPLVATTSDPTTTPKWNGGLPVTSASCKGSLNLKRPAVALNGAGGEIRLPTEPLELSAVAASTGNTPPPPKMIKLCEIGGQKEGQQQQQQAPVSKRQFVRPFEDDYSKPTVEKSTASPEKISGAQWKGNLVGQNGGGKPVVTQEEKATLHYQNSVVKLPMASCQNSFSLVDNNNIEIKMGDVSALPQETLAPTPVAVNKDQTEGNDKVSKEKLKYLRYFRLITHRKRNDVEIEKLEKRKSRYLERSPSPVCHDEDAPRPLTPSLPLPSIPPHLNRLSESNAKVMYMSAIGLWRVPDEEKQGNEDTWNIILDDRLARKSLSTTSSYFVKLREMSQISPSPSAANSFFLDPDVVLPPRPSPVQTPQLPILLSSLVPLPQSSATSQVVQTFLNGAQPVRALTPVAMSPKPAKARVPIISWPGIEAIAESYSDYAKDCREEKLVLQNRLREVKQEMMERRSKVDALSARMSNLSRYQRLQINNQQKMETQLQTMTQVLVKYSSQAATQ